METATRVFRGTPYSRASTATSRKPRLLAALSVVLLGSTSFAAAQSTVLPEILVTSPTLVATPLAQIASSVTVITREDIEQQQLRTVPDALKTVPGLNIIQSGGPGGLTSVFMRGTDPRHTKILIDGIDVSDPSTVTRIFDLGQMLTADIDRIEVLRGPQSGLYGADALGGVISITTRKGEGPPKVTATVEGGSFGRFNQTASLSGSQDRFNYAFNVAHFQAPRTPTTPPELVPPGRRINNDFYDNVTYSHRLGFDPNEDLSFNWFARSTYAKLRFTGEDFNFFPSVPAEVRSAQGTNQLFTRGEAIWTLFDGRFKNYFGVNYTDHRTSRFSPDTGFGAFNGLEQGERVKYDWRGVANVMPGQTVVFGLERDRESLDNASLSGSLPDSHAASNGNSAGYVELQSEYQNRFFLVANLRHDINDAFGPHTTYRVAPAVIVPETETKLKGSYGTGFKAPTLTQLFVDFPTFLFFGNPNLRPETSKGYDFGFEQPLLDNRLRFGVTYFHNDVKDFISPVTIGIDPGTGFAITQYDNVAQFESQGIEAFAAAVVNSYWKVRADYTFTEVDAADPFALLRKPRHKVSATAIWTPMEQLTLATTLLYVSAWRDLLRGNTSIHLDQPGYTVINVAANYVVNEHVTAFARIDNLFDKRYQNPNGFQQTGFGIYGGIRLASR
jgi:vitamin B12 transporter